VTDELPDAANGWRFEAWEIHKRRGWNFYRAYDHVLVRYLAAGDARPLLDLICNLRRQPGRQAREFVAAITDGEALLERVDGISDLPRIEMRRKFRHCNPLYAIRISEHRGRGHPAPDDPFKSERRLALVFGFCSLATGLPPQATFWPDLAAAFDLEGYEQRSKGRPFPFKAKLVRTDGGTGRSRDLELETRDKVLHAAVAKKIEGGRGYKAAVEEVRREIEEQARAERALGKVVIGAVESGTIRAAYDTLSRRGRKS